MKKHIVIVEIISTGFNFVEDVLARDYQVILEEVHQYHPVAVV